jgi:hypothetical protein
MEHKWGVFAADVGGHTGLDCVGCTLAQTDTLVTKLNCPQEKYTKK